MIHRNPLALRVLTTLVILLAPPLVAAHAVVVSSTPADRAVLTRVPPEVELRFNARLEKKLVHVKLDRADGATQALTDVAPEPARVRVTLPQDLPAGAYTLHYKVLATDGHATQGVLRFSLKGLP
ncbi:MAG: copper resistance protein CopC [Gammaproteobacteria bacterium]|nr:copper resistance protein CopC [Gammaproteobacteria bacterium]